MKVRVRRPAPFTQVSSNMTVSLDVVFEDAAAVQTPEGLRRWLQGTAASDAKKATRSPPGMQACISMASIHFPADVPVAILDACLSLTQTGQHPCLSSESPRLNPRLDPDSRANIPYGEHDLVVNLLADDKVQLSTQTVRFLSTPIVTGRTRVGQPYSRRSVDDYLRCSAMTKRIQSRAGQDPASSKMTLNRGGAQRHKLVTMGVLVHRSLGSFADSVRSWHRSNLWACVSEIMVYLQEWPFPNDGKPRTLEEVSRVERRLRPMFSTSLANQSHSPHLCHRSSASGQHRASLLAPSFVVSKKQSFHVRGGGLCH